MFLRAKLEKWQKRRRVQSDLTSLLSEMSQNTLQAFSSDELVSLITLAETESEWSTIVFTLIDYCTVNDLTAPFTNTLLSQFALHTMEASKAISDYCVGKMRDKTFTVDQSRNALIVLAVFAEKMIGHQSAFVFTDDCCSTLLSVLRNPSHPMLQLYALLALDSFAMTSENKDKILAHNIVETLTAMRGPSSLESSHPLDPSSSWKFQLAFCVNWSLLNLYAGGNAFHPDKKAVESVQVILTHIGSSGKIKLPWFGLEARNDATSFETVKSTVSVKEGCWYYEFTLHNPGIVQIGWTGRDFRYEEEDGQGVGDDLKSFAYDGSRRVFWHNGVPFPYGKKRWKTGDVVGVFLDIPSSSLSFSLNGEGLGNALALLPYHVPLKEFAKGGLSPAASLMTYSHLSINFGHQPFRYPCPERFKPVNSAGNLTDEEKILRPRAFQVMEEIDESRPLCQICFENPPTTQLLPCKHSDLCFTCALQCEICPLCRVPVAERCPISNDREDATASGDGCDE